MEYNITSSNMSSTRHVVRGVSTNQDGSMAHKHTLYTSLGDLLYKSCALIFHIFFLDFLAKTQRYNAKLLLLLASTREIVIYYILINSVIRQISKCVFLMPTQSIRYVIRLEICTLTTPHNYFSDFGTFER